MIKYENNTLKSLIKERTDKNPDKVFAYFKHEHILYRDLELKTNRLSNALTNMGIKKSHHVGLLAENCPEFLLGWFSLVKLGAVMVPINTKLKGDLLEYIINHSEIQTLIIQDHFLDVVVKLKDQILNLKNLIIIGNQWSIEQLKFGDISVINFQELINFNDDSEPKNEVRFYDPMSILYTSGTTGRSKGVILPNQYYFYVGEQYRKCRNLGETDVNYTALPWFHAAAQIIHTIPSFLGNGTIAMSDAFNPGHFWEDIKEFQATQFHFLSNMIYSLWNYPEREMDSDHPPIIAFGGPTPWKIKDEFARRFNVSRFIEGFGQTECLYLGMDYQKTTLDQLVEGSCGRPFEGFDVRIVDEHDIELPNGELGEIVVRAEHPYTMFNGYYKNPEATVSTNRNLWFHTGDRGYKDNDNNFYFVDRIKDAIRKGGENISSFELEAIIVKHPKVKECAAIPVDGDADDDVMVILDLENENGDFDHFEFLKWCKESMPYYMVPRYIRIISSLPKTPTHKVEKYKLKQDGITSDTWDRKKHGVNLKTL